MLTEAVSYPAAFLAGFLSFISPCILPLVPAYFTFITGLSLEQLTNNNLAIRHRVLAATLSFVAGFSLVFILMGASASYLGGVLFEYKNLVRVIGGFMILLFGIHLSGIFRIKALDFEKRVHLRTKPGHAFGTLAIGMAFGAGWSPCIGPLLGSILILAGNQETVLEGTLLLAAYAAGLAIPFLILSVFIHFFLAIVRKTQKTIRYANAVAGILLIGMGLLLITDKLGLLNFSR